jgi:hypothetical protein
LPASNGWRANLKKADAAENNVRWRLRKSALSRIYLVDKKKPEKANRRREKSQKGHREKQEDPLAKKEHSSIKAATFMK